MANPFRNVSNRLNENARRRQYWLRGGSTPEGLRDRSYPSRQDWAPDIDVLIRGRDLVILVDLPGMRPEEVDLTLSEGLLSVSGYRRSNGRRSNGSTQEEDGSGGVYYTRERCSGPFYRSIGVPVEVSEGEIEASLEDGVLEIIIEGYADLSEPRRIEVRGSEESIYSVFGRH